MAARLLELGNQLDRYRAERIARGGVAHILPHLIEGR
jgi:hypothetical protein